eukprot:TRINITY_DN110976_c0_g1_i1.p1 TRINITY_DN110976_c0_g1~~TRINITY_DN110976_c0_g1_i1.p1  ORF type:complete len:491 (+),score=65.54 TRINITY_DN110976_c0_g1_i1:71-1474(+)
MECHTSSAATCDHECRPDGCASEHQSDELEHGRCLKDISWYMWPILVSIDSIGSFTSDAYLPSLPRVADDLQTTTNLTSLTVQVNIISMALGSIAIGFLADRYGRRPMLLVGLSIYVASSAIAAWAPYIGVLIAVRVVMGFTQGCQVLAPVLARDLIDDRSKRMQVTAVLGGCNAVAIVAAPSIGGVLGQYVGWRGIFVFLAIWGSLTLLAYWALIPETRPALQAPSEEEINKSWTTNVRTLFASRTYIGFVGMLGLMFFCIMSMLTLLPFVLGDYYALKVDAVGFIMGAIPLSGMSGSIISYIAGKCLEPFSLVRWGMIPYALVLGLTTALMFKHHHMSEMFWPVLLTCIPMVALHNIFIPVAMSLALEDMKDNAGVAQGFATFTQFLLMAAGSTVAASVWNGTPSSFFATLAVGMTMTAAWFWICCRPPTALGGNFPGADKGNLDVTCKQSVSPASSARQEEVAV